MLKTENLKIYFGGLAAVNDVTIDIEDGEIHSLIGPNGAGKTTLFNLIYGVFKPTSGKIYFKGQSIEGKPVYKINSLGISRTYQNIKLYKNLSALENVMLGLHPWIDYNIAAAFLHTKKMRTIEREVKEKALNTMKFLGIEEKQNNIAGSLPYGDQRLLEIARALVGNPSLLMLDEPAAGMNTAEKNDLIELIRRIRDTGVTVLLVEHDIRLVMGISDRITVLNYGNVICRGTPEYVKNDPNAIEAYLGGE
jgi:branched-chain amino acid transport system ATP-binding protein